MLRAKSTRTARAQGEAASHVDRDLSDLRLVSRHDSGMVSPIGSRDRSTLLYLFRTDCGFCTQQRELIASRLASLSPTSVVTASVQATSIVEAYWEGTPLRGTVPSRVLNEDLHRFELRFVPTLVLIDGGGRVRRAHVGLADAKTIDLFTAELRSPAASQVARDSVR